MGRNTKKQKREKSEHVCDKAPRHPLVRDLSRADKQLLSYFTRSFASYGASAEANYDEKNGVFGYMAEAADGRTTLAWNLSIQFTRIHEVVLQAHLDVRDEASVLFIHEWTSDTWRLKSLFDSDASRRLLEKLLGTPVDQQEVPVDEKHWIRIVDAMGREWRLRHSKQGRTPERGRFDNRAVS